MVRKVQILSFEQTRIPYKRTIKKASGLDRFGSEPASSPEAPFSYLCDWILEHEGNAMNVTPTIGNAMAE